MRNKIGTSCMVLGIVLVFAALSLFIYNQQEAKKANEAAERVLPEIISYIQIADEAMEWEQEGEAEPVPPVWSFEEEEYEFFDDPDPAMTEVEFDGYAYIGYLSIPALELELPVMASWDYARLKIAPCLYSGSVKTDNIVIMAHNYERHFGNISKLSQGDAVSFTDMDGVSHEYEVVEVVTMMPTAIEEMTAGDYDLTLFTCTYGGQYRIAVRCERIES